MTLLVEANHIPTSHLYHPRQIVRAGILARGGYATTHDGFQPIKSRIVDTVPSRAVHRVLHWNTSSRSAATGLLDHCADRQGLAVLLHQPRELQQTDQCHHRRDRADSNKRCAHCFVPHARAAYTAKSRVDSSRGSEGHFVPSFRVQSSLCQLSGVASWVHYRGRRARAPWKAADRIVRSPTDLSVERFPASASWSFGLRTLHRTSLRQSAAASDRQSAICPITIGQAMRSPRSSLRSFDVIQCATCG